MRNFYVSVLTLLLLLFAGKLSAHRYTFSMSLWDANNRHAERVEISSGSVSVTLNPEQRSQTITTSSVISSFTITIKGYFGNKNPPGRTEYSYNYTVSWPSNERILDPRPGDAGFYVDCLWEPEITITSIDNPNSTIPCDKEISVTLNKHGFTGEVGVFIGKTNGFTNYSYCICSGSSETLRFTPDNSWNAFQNLFGSADEALKAGFYIKPECYNSPPGNGPYYLQDYLVFYPEIEAGAAICGDLYIKPRHLLKPFTVNFNQGGINYSLNCSGDSLMINQSILSTEDIVPNIGVNIKIIKGSIQTRNEVLDFMIPAPGLSSSNVQSYPESCSINNDGKIVITRPFDSADEISYFYKYNGHSGSSTSSDKIYTLPGEPGLYSLSAAFTINGNIGCIVELGDHVIKTSPLLEITSLVESQKASCSYKADAIITIQTKNGILPIHYETETADFSPSQGVKPNTTYYIKAVDSKNCSTTFSSITTSLVDELQLSVTNSDPIKCFGDLASESITVIGNQGNYSVKINEGEVIPSNPFDFKGHLHVPSYSIVATDSKGCIDQLTTSFPEPSQLVIDHENYEVSNYLGYNVKCHGNNDGWITLSGTGGSGSAVFHLQDSLINLSQENNSFKYLSAGKYNAFLSDINNCFSDTIKGIELKQPEDIVFQKVAIVPETCLNTRDADIITTIYGNPTSFQWYDKNKFPIVSETGRNLIDTIPGVYYLEAKYNKDTCSSMSLPYIISPTPSFDITTQTHESCADAMGGGEIRIKGISNGKEPYSYILNNEPEKVINSFPVVFKNLPRSSYTIEIRDSSYLKGGIYADKCKVSLTFTIDPKENAYIKPDIQQPLCFGNSNGKISANIIGPDHPFLYAWYNSKGDSIGSGTILENIPRGNYSALMKDTFNCLISQTELHVEEPPLLSFSGIETVKAGCDEILDGHINIAVQGGKGNKKYSADKGATWQASSGFAGMKSALYEIQVRDSNYCLIDTSVMLDVFIPKLTRIRYDSITCFGDADGQLVLNASESKYHGSGYNYVVEYAPENSRSNNTGIFEKLDKGNYRMYALDINNCSTDTLLQTMWEPEKINVQLNLIDSASCSQYTGKISKDITGGNGLYQIMWYNNKTGDTPFLDTTALQTGWYVLTVQDRKFCTEQAEIFIPDRPSPVIASVEEISPTWCNLPLGSAKVTAYGGSPGYSYKWDNAGKDIGPVADSLIEGIYSIVITDRYNCRDSASIELTDGPEIALTSQTDNPHCGQKDGKISLNVNGGVKPYIYQWPDSVSITPITDPVMEDLYSGLYPVEVLDKVGCRDTFFIALSDLSGPAIRSVGISKSWCSLPRGKANVKAEGGFPPYSYAWFNEETSEIIGKDIDIDSLTKGNYTVSIIDNEQCKVVKRISIADSVELQPKLVFVSLDSAACEKPVGKIKVSMAKGLPPYSYRWNGFSSVDSLFNIRKGNYKVISTDARGCMDSINVQLPDKKAPVISLLSKTSAYCGQPSGTAMFEASLGNPPYLAYLVSDITHKTTLSYNAGSGYYQGTLDSLLPLPDPYKIKIYDANGCLSNETGVMIQNNDPLRLSLVSMEPVSCYGLSDGKATVNAVNGFEPYTFQWNKNSVNNNLNANLPAGKFTVTVTDARNCVKSLTPVAPIIQPEALMLSSVYINDPSCYNICDGMIVPIAYGGNGNYNYVWNASDTSQTGRNLCPGENKVAITDSKGCKLTSSFKLINPPQLYGTELPDSAIICSGQHYKAFAGNDWNQVSWWSDNGFNSFDPVADIDQPGLYYMTGYNYKGCQVKDTFKIIISDNLLDAEFLMMSESYVGDTVVLIEVSWPVAETYNWEIPESASIIKDESYYKELVFNKPGNFYIELTATLAGCTSVKGKNIKIFDIQDKEVEMIIENGESLIQSFSIYPNPAEQDFKADIILSENRDIRIEIISISNGALNRVINEYSQDKYNLPVNIEELMPGTYAIRLKAGNEVKTKILIVK